MTEDLQPLIAHLVELRDRLLKIGGVLLIALLGIMPWAAELYHFLAMPMLKALPAGGQMIATDVTTPFFVPLKVALMTAFLLTLPNTLYQLWAFVAPGLYQHEKRLIGPLIASSLVLFVAGMAFAYFLVFPVIFHFMSSVAPQGVAVMTDIDNYLSFILGMFLAFGVTFEVPIVVIILVHYGIVPLEKLKGIRSYIIVGAFVIAAVVTPPDVLSQIMLAVPLWLLYEAGVIVAGWMAKGQRRQGSAAG